MKSKKIYESIGDLLKPKGVESVLKEIKDLPVSEKIEKIKTMQHTWKGMYNDLLSNDEILRDIRSSMKKELDEMNIIEKVNYIERLENNLPDIFSGMRDPKTVKALRDYVLTQPFDRKNKFLWRFYRTWPDIFTMVKNDKTVDEETNKVLLLFKIKYAIDKKEIEELQNLISEMGERYGRKNIMDFAKKILIPDRYGDDVRLFNSSDLNQLELSLYKETRSEEQQMRDEHFDVYAFIGYNDFKEVEIDGETYHKKRLGIENLVKIDLYDAGSLKQVTMMKMRATVQYGGDGGTYAVYIPKTVWNKDRAYNDDIPDSLRKYIDENKFSV